MNNVLMIKGASQYDVLRYFVDDIAESFRQMGCNVDIFDFCGEIENTIRQQIYQSDYDMIISFYGLSEKLLEKINKNKDTKVLLYLMDHPYYRHDWLSEKHNNFSVACVDREHCRYVEKYYPNVNSVYYIPHGGMYDESKIVDYKSRDIDVCFIGTLAETTAYDEIKEILPNVLWEVIEESVQDILQGSSTPTEKVLTANLSKKGISLSDDERIELMQVFARADSYIRSRQREQIILGLANAGIRVDVYGSGWERLGLEGYDNIRLHGNASYEETWDIVGRSKILLNKMPLFSDGSHDRVFSAMASGAVCFTDKSKYFEEELEDGKDICCYDVRDIEGLAAKIKYILGNEEAAEIIAKSGMRKAREQHLWKNRISLFEEACGEKMIASKSSDTSEYKISIIIPCHNEEQNIDGCMRSLLSYEIDFIYTQVIFVNDGSTDETYTRLLEYENKYSDNILVLNLDAHYGSSYAKSLALDYVMADKIAFAEPGDISRGHIYDYSYDRSRLCVETFTCDEAYLDDYENAMSETMGNAEFLIYYGMIRDRVMDAINYTQSTDSYDLKKINSIMEQITNAYKKVYDMYALKIPGIQGIAEVLQAIRAVNSLSDDRCLESCDLEKDKLSLRDELFELHKIFTRDFLRKNYYRQIQNKPYVITNLNAFMVVSDLIKKIDAKRVLDAGAFLQRIGAVSRMTCFAKIAPEVVLDTYEKNSKLNLPIYRKIYDSIYNYLPDKDYDLICLMYLQGAFSCNEQIEICEYVVLHGRGILFEFDNPVCRKYFKDEAFKYINVNGDTFIYVNTKGKV